MTVYGRLTMLHLGTQRHLVSYCPNQKSQGNAL